MKQRIQMALGLACIVPAFGQSTTRAIVSPIPILRAAALPTFPPIALAARISGKVVVHITVRNGQVVQADLPPAQNPPRVRFLEVPTVKNVKTWRFDATVNTRFTVKYTYKIAGKPTKNPTNAKVAILPSLNVIVTARPVKPTCSDCGAPPMKIIPRSIQSNQLHSPASFQQRPLWPHSHLITPVQFSGPAPAISAPPPHTAPTQPSATKT